MQLPFSSINYGTCTLLEGRLITDAILNCSIEGVGPQHKTPIFPCGIFQYMPGVNDKPGTPNYDLFRKALYSTSKRIYPNYCLATWSVNQAGIKKDREIKQSVINKLDDDFKQNLINWIKCDPNAAAQLSLKLENDQIVIDNTPLPFEISSTMGCRTYNGFDINFTEEYFESILVRAIAGEDYSYELFSAAQKDGRGNLCPVTIILPTLAMEAVRDVEKFMKLLAKKINEAKDMLLERYTYMCSQSAKSARFMYDNRTMFGYHPEDGIESALKHGTLVIGQLGLAETLELLIGCDHTTEEGMLLAKRIEQLYKDLCAQFKEEYSLNFGVYYTPAESLCYTAMNNFKDKYGVIPKVSDKEYFTNSMHVPVYVDITPFEKIDIESQLTGYSSGGCITYVEIDSAASQNIDALEELVTYAMNKDIPYFAMNFELDWDPNCGFSGEIGEACPICGNTVGIQRLRRVTGYLTGSYKESFNYGKQKETEARVRHRGIISGCDY